MNEVLINKIAIRLASLQGVMGDAQFYQDEAKDILRIVEGEE